MQGWLLDNVYAIREAAILHLVKLVQVRLVMLLDSRHRLKGVWARLGQEEHRPQNCADGRGSHVPVAPHHTLLHQRAQHDCPSARIICLPQALADVADEDISTKDLLPVTLKLAKDAVPNVRFNAARVLQKLIPKVTAG